MMKHDYTFRNGIQEPIAFDGWMGTGGYYVWCGGIWENTLDDCFDAQIIVIIIIR